MAGVDAFGVGSFLALFLGTLLLVGGLYGRKRGYRRNLEGFALLGSFIAIVGVVALTFGIYGVLKG